MTELRREIYEKSVAEVEAWLRSGSCALPEELHEHLDLLEYLIGEDTQSNPRNLVAAVRGVLAVNLPG